MEFLIVIYNNKDKTYRNVTHDSLSTGSSYISAKYTYLRKNEVITNIIPL